MRLRPFCLAPVLLLAACGGAISGEPAAPALSTSAATASPTENKAAPAPSNAVASAPTSASPASPAVVPAPPAASSAGATTPVDSTSTAKQAPTVAASEPLAPAGEEFSPAPAGSWKLARSRPTASPEVVWSGQRAYRLKLPEFVLQAPLSDTELKRFDKRAAKTSAPVASAEQVAAATSGLGAKLRNRVLRGAVHWLDKQHDLAITLEGAWLCVHKLERDTHACGTVLESAQSARLIVVDDWGRFDGTLERAQAFDLVVPLGSPLEFQEHMFFEHCVGLMSRVLRGVTCFDEQEEKPAP